MRNKHLKILALALLCATAIHHTAYASDNPCAPYTGNTVDSYRVHANAQFIPEAQRIFEACKNPGVKYLSVPRTLIAALKQRNFKPLEVQLWKDWYNALNKNGWDEIKALDPIKEYLTLHLGIPEADITPEVKAPVAIPQLKATVVPGQKIFTRPGEVRPLPSINTNSPKPAIQTQTPPIQNIPKYNTLNADAQNFDQDWGDSDSEDDHTPSPPKTTALPNAPTTIGSPLSTTVLPPKPLALGLDSAEKIRFDEAWDEYIGKLRTGTWPATERRPYPMPFYKAPNVLTGPAKTTEAALNKQQWETAFIAWVDGGQHGAPPTPDTILTLHLKAPQAVNPRPKFILPESIKVTTQQNVALASAYKSAWDDWNSGGRIGVEPTPTSIALAQGFTQTATPTVATNSGQKTGGLGARTVPTHLVANPARGSATVTKNQGPITFITLGSGPAKPIERMTNQELLDEITNAGANGTPVQIVNAMKEVVSALPTPSATKTSNTLQQNAWLKAQVGALSSSPPSLPITNSVPVPQTPPNTAQSPLNINPTLTVSPPRGTPATIRTSRSPTSGAKIETIDLGGSTFVTLKGINNQQLLDEITNAAANGTSPEVVAKLTKIVTKRDVPTPDNTSNLLIQNALLKERITGVPANITVQLPPPIATTVQQAAPLSTPRQLPPTPVTNSTPSQLPPYPNPGTAQLPPPPVTTAPVIQQAPTQTADQIRQEIITLRALPTSRTTNIKIQAFERQLAVMGAGEQQQAPSIRTITPLVIAPSIAPSLVVSYPSPQISTSAPVIQQAPTQTADQIRQEIAILRNQPSSRATNLKIQALERQLLAMGAGEQNTPPNNTNTPPVSISNPGTAQLPPPVTTAPVIQQAPTQTADQIRQEIATLKSQGSSRNIKLRIEALERQLAAMGA